MFVWRRFYQYFIVDLQNQPSLQLLGAEELVKANQGQLKNVGS